MPDRLLRLDEGAADVVVADQAEPHRDARLLGVADRGADARVGDRHDDVGVDGRLARQLPAELGADLVDAAAEHVAVGAREVDVLEDAVRERLRRERLERPDRRAADDQHLARLDVAHVGGADEVERAGLRADDHGVAEPPEHERPEPVRVARGEDLIPGDHRQRVRAAHLRQRLDDRVLDRRVAFDRANRCTMTSVSVVVWKIEPCATRLVLEVGGVDQVAVVRDAELPVRALDEQRLRVLDLARAGGRVAHVADGDCSPVRPRQRVLREDVGDHAHRRASIRTVRPSDEAMPALSCPRCCRA